MEESSVSVVEALCLGTSLTISGILYCVYRKKKKTVDKLKDAPQLALDGKLRDLLNVTPGKCLQYVVIEGTVQPVSEPLRSQFQEGAVGVVQKLMLREHKLVWNSLARAWTDSERVLHQRVHAVPFNLTGPGEGEAAAVRVLCPLEASSLTMEIIHEKFHQATYGFSDIIGHSAPPTDGSEYFLTTSDFETLRIEQEGQAAVWQVLASVFALAGAAVLLWSPAATTATEAALGAGAAEAGSSRPSGRVAVARPARTTQDEAPV
ncbi:hypothetical protein CRUP_022099 [Coryphaenoides rupestris]|nr:hypothetical protein CRUP_022099 [Coryphaenoides rupestris]